MRAAPLLVAWHDEKAPIYSVHFQPHGKGRLATAGGDNNIRLWSIVTKADERNVVFLATLQKHQQAVNVVRWSPREELLASAGDDGNVLIWAQSDFHTPSKFGDEDADDQETWIVKRMCRSNARPDLGIYDLAWSPDGRFFVTGSTDNVARIFDASTGTVIRQIAEHNHYVQGVTWDPLNEYIATQSSDRSVHIYKLETSDGQSALGQPALYSRMSRMDLPSRRRISSSSPAPPEFGHRQSMGSLDGHLHPNHSPATSQPGTPAATPLPMNPPPPGHHRRTSRGNSSPAVHRSPSPAPSMPLPAVMPSASPNFLGARNTNIYANETLTSFFRRLTFAPDGSLLFTPAGQYKVIKPPTESGKSTDEIINTVYIYSRGGLNKPPIAHLPGHRKPSIAVRCSPIRYNLRLPAPTRNITIDTSSTSDDMGPLPDPVVSNKASSSNTAMDPPPPISGAPMTPAPSTTAPSPKSSVRGNEEAKPTPDGPAPAFALPYRIVYAVATQDAVFIYDTQQQTPLCVVSNLHFATFTDLGWSNDGQTLLMSSSDGFCSALSFSPGEIGSAYHGPPPSRAHRPSAIDLSQNNSAFPTPLPSTTADATTTNTTTTTSSAAGRPQSSAGLTGGFAPPPLPNSPSPMSFTSTSYARPSSPTRSNSASSSATQSSSFPFPHGSHSHSHSHSHTGSSSGSGNVIISNPTPHVSKLPSVAAQGSVGVGGMGGALPSPTPPLTPLHHSHGTASGVHSVSHSASNSISGSFGGLGVAPVGGSGGVVPAKREGESMMSTSAGSEGAGVGVGEEGSKRRRVAPTLVDAGAGVSGSAAVPAQQEQKQEQQGTK